MLDTVNGLLQVDKIRLSGHVNQEYNDIYYDQNKKIFYIKKATLIKILSKRSTFYYTKKAIKGDKSALKYSNKILSRIIGPLLYTGVHLYQHQTRGGLINNVLTKQWYISFFQAMTYEHTKLTTLSKEFGILWTNFYLNYIYELFELPMMERLRYSNDDVKKVNKFFGFKFNTIVEEIAKQNVYDNDSLKSLSDMFPIFSKEFSLCVVNQNRRLVAYDDKDLEKWGFELLKLDLLYNAYSDITSAKCKEYRFITPIMRELFITAEPLAQTIHAACLDGSKIKHHVDLQNMAIKGLGSIQ